MSSEPISTTNNVSAAMAEATERNGSRLPSHEPAAPAARAIALYLPQFHPIPENDRWWGKGFTEWTNTAKARPLYRGHYQPHVPADLGFYDLRLPAVREAQAAMARSAGIEAFCYYHYWFAGRRILERPFAEVLASGQPDYPFCLCWANETWSGVWHGASDRILIEQTYPGEDDHRAHFAALLPAFSDPRYVRVEGKPLFLIYKPEKLPDPQATLALWRKLAVEAGLPGLHVAGMTARPDWQPQVAGFDAKVPLPLVNLRPWISRRRPLAWVRQQVAIRRGLPTFHDYDERMQEYLSRLQDDLVAAGGGDVYPCIVHAWDNTPRSGARGVVLTGTSPERFSAALRRTITAISDRRPQQQRLVFLKSWNEWAEGNHLEPDLAYGSRWLDAVRDALVGGGNDK